MKRHFYTLGLMLAATFTLTNCAQEIDNPNDVPSAGIPFEIVATSAETKTANSASVVSWVAGDALNVFHAEAGATEYVNDNNFTIAEEDLTSGRFTGTLTAALTADSYDWYAFYPYSSYIKTPANTSNGYTPIGSEAGVQQTQNGYDNMDHIAGENYPLYGVATGVASNVKPSFEMKHAYTIAKIVVKNTTDKELTVNTVSFTAPEAIVGTYYINFAGETLVYTGSGEKYVSNVANLTVSAGTALAKNAEATFYLAFKPFTAAAGSELKIAVNGYEKTLPLENSVTFDAGKIKTLNFSYNNEEERESISIPWSEDFSGDISQYSLVSGGSTTKLYDNDNLAGGKAPELLVSKTNGSFSATIATGGYIGKLTLTFKSNHADYLTVATTTEGVEITKNNDAEYVINISAQVESFDLTFKNTQSSNTRLDDIELVKGAISSQTISFEKSTVSLELGSDDFSAFTGQAVNGAMTDVAYASDNTDVAEVDSKTGVVTLKSVAGSATITATAVATEEYRGATATYVIVVKEQSIGGGTTRTISFKLDQATTGNSSTAYVQTEASFIYDGVGYKVNNWNPKTLQIRGNQTTQTNLQSGKNFYLRNTTAIPGTITSISVEYTSGELVATKIYAISSASEITNQSTSSSTAGTAKTGLVIWDLADGGSYFAIGLTKGGTSGTALSGTITITYNAN